MCTDAGPFKCGDCPAALGAPCRPDVDEEQS